METGKNDKILAIIIGAAGLAVLAVTVFGVLLWGPLEPVLRNTRTLLMMAEVVLVFFWNLFCLAGGRGKSQGQVHTGGSGLWDWQRESCCLPGATVFSCPWRYPAYIWRFSYWQGDSFSGCS